MREFGQVEATLDKQRIIKRIDAAGIVIVRGEDGQPQIYHGVKDDRELAQLVARHDAAVEAEAADKVGKVEAEVQDKQIAQLAAIAQKAVPDVLAHLQAVQYRASVDYLPALEKAIGGLQ